MRRLILIIVAAVFVVAVAGAAGWRYLRPHDQLAEARQMMAQGNLRGAQLVLRGLVQADPGRAEAHFRLGQVQLALGDPTAAEKELRAAGEHGSDAKALTPLLARAVLMQGRYDDVLRDYKPDGLDPAPAASVLVARAEAQLAQKQVDDAVATIAQAQALAPKSVEVALAAARLALVRHDPKGAETQADAALAIDPKSLEALMLQAELRAGRGDRQGALDSYDTAANQAIAAGPGGAGGLDSVRLARAGLLMALNDDKRARDDVDAVLKAQPKNPLANYVSAQLFERARDWKSADAALSAVGPVLDRIPRSDVILAVVKANLGQPEQAIAAAQRQVARSPEDLGALILLARLHLMQQQPDKAAELLAAAAADGHSSAETLDLMGQIYASTGRSQQALEAIQQASALAPEDTRLLTRLAALEMRQGDSSQATKTLERALDLSPADPPAAQPASPVVPVAQTSAAPGTTQLATTTPTGTPAAPGTPPAVPTKAQTAAALIMAALRAGEIDHALIALDRLREAKGDPVQVATMTGLVKLAQIDLAGARSAFEEARRLDPASLQAKLNLARVLALQGHADEAGALLEETLAADRANAAVLSSLVDLRLGQRQPEKAVAAAEAAHAAKPDDLGIVTGLAELYLRTGQAAKALALLDAVGPAPDARAAPGLAAARVRAQLALGQRPAAVAGLRALLDGSPDDPGLRRDLAQLLVQDKDFDGARTVLRDGLARRPGDPTLLATSIALAGQEGGPDAALARAKELAGDPANAASARRLQGDLLMGQRKYADAAALFQAQLAALPPDSPDAERLTVARADAVAAGGDAAKASSLLRDWLAAHPTSAAAALMLSGLDITAHRLPDARTHLDLVLASQPNNPAALNNLAWVNQQMGDLDRARTLASRAYLLAATPQSADTLGWVMLAQGNASAALALLREAAGRSPDDPAVQYHLAAALAKDGQKDAARAVLKALLDMQAGKTPAAFDERPAAEKLLADL